MWWDWLVGVALALVTALPLAWKWQLGLRRTATGVGGLGIMTGILVVPTARWLSLGAGARAALTWLTTLGLALATLAYRFFRDPERRPPDDSGAIVSPADGEVLYVRESHGGMLPVANKQGQCYPLYELTRTPLRAQDAVVVGIGMSFLDVHVNRAPISGRVVLRRHFPGQFGSLRRPGMAFANERATTVIERGDLQVAVVQIASRLVRQIVGFVREGDYVALGQRLGVIRLGSQVDLVVPARPDLKVVVQAGARVVAGESVVATVECASVPAPAQAGASTGSSAPSE